MIAGDGNGNGQIQNDDSENIWKPDNGTSGYKNSDYNMDGQLRMMIMKIIGNLITEEVHKFLRQIIFLKDCIFIFL